MQDRGPKARLCAAAGVPEYWIVDLAARALVVQRAPDGEAYADVRVLRSGRVAPVAFPMAEVPVEALVRRRPSPTSGKRIPGSRGHVLTRR